MTLLARMVVTVGVAYAGWAGQQPTAIPTGTISYQGGATVGPPSNIGLTDLVVHEPVGLQGSPPVPQNLNFKPGRCMFVSAEGRPFMERCVSRWTMMRRAFRRSAVTVLRLGR